VGGLASFGDVLMVGVEGPGSWGVGVSRSLRDQDIVVVEVDRPNRQTRRKVGKSDPADAVAAATAALSGAASVIRKRATGRWNRCGCCWWHAVSPAGNASRPQPIWRTNP
jgi:hypothetical protein